MIKREVCPRCASKHTSTSTTRKEFNRGYTHVPAEYEHFCRDCGFYWETKGE